ncbi:hypothetical protein C7Y47_24030 [Lysinibacillus sphaericus]|uniref:Uncharacterized protein n=1 Tax=Lysinibacillus sphaericus TaxID=1421 RepID=A0A544U7E4_LYSSH|nr:hypothetical protein [Lysinibacillus sp. SDF0037]TQR26858.1 hypothetical protein C7Y47_24030 [Lysinibacillus sp. SDF0037]
MKKLIVVPVAALTLGFGFAGDITSASASEANITNTVPVMTKMAAIDLLVDDKETTEDGFYNGAFEVDSGRDVRMYIKNKGNVTITVKVYKDGSSTPIVNETIKGNGHKELTKYLSSGDYSYSIDAKGHEVDFQFRAVGL